MNDSGTARLSASEFVADTLRQEILRGDLLPGQPLLQDHLASRFDVSQSSVREALRRLEASALAHSVRNRGTFVSSLTIEQAEELYEVRLALELVALRHNLPLLTKAQLDEAEALLDQIDREEITFLGDAHKRFHATFFESTDRTFARDMLRNIYGNLTRVWVDFVKKRPGFARRYEQSSRREHRELLHAVRGRDLQRAEKILTSHIGRARTMLIEHLREFGPQDTSKPKLRAAAKTARRSPRAAATSARGAR